MGLIDERLIALARQMARQNHVGIVGSKTQGHVGFFDACPHLDCLAVRTPAAEPRSTNIDWSSADKALAVASPALAAPPQDVAHQIMNLQCTLPANFNAESKTIAYKLGFRDARHLAAELVTALAKG